MSDFFIGYTDSIPTGIKKRLFRVSLFLLVLSALLASTLVRSQNDPGDGTFEYGKVRSYEGFLTKGTVPLLIVSRTDTERPHSYLLVSEGKRGFDSSQEAGFVSLDATLIRRDGVLMLEVAAGSVHPTEKTFPLPVRPASFIGLKTIIGEIVDSKCFLGVMKPGNGTVHRACARACLAGGIPPMLILKNSNDRLQYALLTGPSGERITETVLPFVGQPVQMTGTLLSHGALYEFRVAKGAVRPYLNSK